MDDFRIWLKLHPANAAYRPTDEGLVQACLRSNQVSRAERPIGLPLCWPEGTELDEKRETP